MNKAEIVDRLAWRLDTSKAEARRLLEAQIDAVSHHLAIGNRVVLRGLGTFDTEETPGRRGRRPTDGATIEIPPGRHVTFRASERLRDAVQYWVPEP